MNLDSQYDQFIEPNSIISETMTQMLSKTADERGDIFAKSSKIKENHIQATEEGDTKTCENESIQNHFICFIKKGSNLFELDGYVSKPIDHGECQDDQFLSKTC